MITLVSSLFKPVNMRSCNCRNLLGILSFLFSYYCSICFPLMLCCYSVCSLSISLHLFRSPSNTSLLSLLLLLVFFILLLFGKDLWHFLFCVPFLLSLFYLSVLLMLPFCFVFYSFTFLFSSLLPYMSPVLTSFESPTLTRPPSVSSFTVHISEKWRRVSVLISKPRFDIKASFAKRPVSSLIKPGNIMMLWCYDVDMQHPELMLCLKKNIE